MNAPARALCASLALSMALAPAAEAKRRRRGLFFDGEVQSVVFDSRALFAASRGRLGDTDKIKIWDLENKRLHLTLDAGAGNGRQTVAFSPDGRVVVSGLGRGVAIWNAVTGRVVRELAASPASGGAHAFNPLGNEVASQRGSDIVLWSVATGEELKKLARWGSDKIRAIAFHPEGRLLAVAGSAGFSGRVDVLDIVDGKLIRTFRESGAGFHSVVFSRDGRMLAAGGYRKSGDKKRPAVSLWRVRGWRPLKRLKLRKPGEMLAAAFSADGRLLASISSTGKGVDVWHVQTGKYFKNLPGVRAAEFGAAAFSPDDALLAAGGKSRVKFWTMDFVRARKRRGRRRKAVKMPRITPDTFRNVTEADWRRAREKTKAPAKLLGLLDKPEQMALMTAWESLDGITRRTLLQELPELAAPDRPAVLYMNIGVKGRRR